MISQFYKMEAQVTSNDVGPSRTIKPSAIMNYIQEIAGVHLRESGLSYEMMKDNGIVFLIVKIAVKINKNLNCGEKFTYETWFEKLEGVKFVRNIVFTDESGFQAIEAKSLWVAANPENHRIVRPTAYPFEIPETTDRTTDVAFKRVDIDEEHAKTETKTVFWSDIDYNYHMNNSVYAEIFCDYYPGGLIDKNISLFQIDFEGEARISDKINIKTSQNGMSAMFEGTIDNRRCFKAYVLTED